MSTISTSETLQKKIDAKIAAIAANANDLPGVIIIHNLRDWSVVWMNKRGLDLLAATLEEVTALTVEEYHARYFNPEDAKDYVPQILNLLEKNNDDEICSFFQQVRLAHSPDWHWHLSSIKVLLRDKAGHPVLTITFAIPVNAMQHITAKVERLLEENTFLRKHYHQFVKLSQRECDILRLMALGKSSPETAEILSISNTTVETHRKNIKQKLNTNSFYELSQYARAFDLI